MKHLKHLKLLFTALLLLYSVGATADYSLVDGIRYQYNHSYSTTCTVYKCETETSCVVIPSSIMSYGTYDEDIERTVTEVEDRAFAQLPSLKTVVFPSTVTHLHYSIFDGSYSLKRVLLPSSVSFMRNNQNSGNSGQTFDGCQAKIIYNVSSLNPKDYGFSGIVVSVPSYTVSGDYVWATENGVHKLIAYIGDATTVVLPDKYQGTDYVINDYAFYACDVVDVTIPASVTAIGDNAFKNCTALKNIAIPGSITKIGRTREKKAGNWEIMQFVGRLFNTQRASVVVMRS